MLGSIGSALLEISTINKLSDRYVKELMDKGWKIVRIADKLGVTRQRAQQIVHRIRKRQVRKP